jgi:hypothetical protein
LKRGGFSLIEVLAAMGAALALIVGGAALLVCSFSAVRKGDSTAALTHATGDRLETLKALPFEDAELAPGEHAAAVDAGPAKFRVALEWRVEDAGDGMKLVRLRARFPGRPGPGASAVLFISRDLGFGP